MYTIRDGIFYGPLSKHQTDFFFIHTYIYIYVFSRYRGSEREHCLGHISRKCQTCRIYPLTKKKKECAFNLIRLEPVRTIQKFKY